MQLVLVDEKVKRVAAQAPNPQQMPREDYSHPAVGHPTWGKAKEADNDDHTY